MWTDSVITNAGAALLAEWASGGVLTLTGAKSGAGTVSSANLRSQTNVTQETQTLSIVRSETTDEGVRLRVRIGAHTEQYSAKQIGVFAKLNDGNAVLLALYQDSTGIAVPAASDIPDFAYDFMAIIVMDNTGTLSVTIDTDAVASVGDLEAAVDVLEDEIDGKAPAAHTHAPADLTAAVPVGKGGTGATSAAQARTNLGITPANIGAAAAAHTHAPTDLNANVPVSKGGTGASDAATARTNLGITPANIGAAPATHTHAPTDLNANVPVSKGGTGASDAATARSNLGITPANIGAAAATHTHAPTDLNTNVPVNKGGTGASTAADARTNLGAAAATHTHAPTDLTAVVPVNKGGTGASTAAAALENLGIIYSETEPEVIDGGIWLKPI